MAENISANPVDAAIAEGQDLDGFPIPPLKDKEIAFYYGVK